MENISQAEGGRLEFAAQDDYRSLHTYVVSWRVAGGSLGSLGNHDKTASARWKRR
jgi:hypothetical protein